VLWLASDGDAEIYPRYKAVIASCWNGAAEIRELGFRRCRECDSRLGWGYVCETKRRPGLVRKRWERPGIRSHSGAKSAPRHRLCSNTLPLTTPRCITHYVSSSMQKQRGTRDIYVACKECVTIITKRIRTTFSGRRLDPENFCESITGHNLRS
jgi:hypothetical protein